MGTMTKRITSDRVSDKYRVVITNDLFNKNTSGRHPASRIVGHLPETFGFSVGSEIGTPFAGYTTNDNIAKFLALTTGASAKVGLATRKLYMGPEPSEISFTIQFDAYYSGFDEVVLPCVFLMMNSVGHEEKLADALDDALTILNIGEHATQRTIESFGLSGDQAESVTDFIRYMRTPQTSNIRFGNVFTLENVYLSTVNVEFSNILDNEGQPLSGSATITGELDYPLTKLRLATAFGNTGVEEEDLESEGFDVDLDIDGARDSLRDQLNPFNRFSFSEEEGDIEP